ncbi:MAG: caspase domain-containing protein [Burkholderiales bacterium]
MTKELIKPVAPISGCINRRLYLTSTLRGAALLAGLGHAWPSLAQSGAATGQRIALVIGNSNYPDAPLVNAVNDARLVHSTLKDMGFAMTLLLDCTQVELLQTTRRWLASANSANVRFIYFAGHGAQYRGRNFLIPVDARLQSEDELPGSAFNVNDLIDRMSRFETGVNLLVLDACRSIPTTSPTTGARLRGIAGTLPRSGLSATLAPRGTLVAYSTAPGALASDNPQSTNSAYTRHLVAHLKIRGLPIETVFKRTRAAVLQDSGGTQVPWESSSLVNDFCFYPDASGQCSGS